MEEPIEDFLAIPDKDAARLAGISLRRLRYLEDKDALVEPTVRNPRATLYGFPQMIELLVVTALRDRKRSLQQIRKLVKHLRGHGYAAPLRELRFATVGKEIYVQHADGTWEGDLRPDQTVLSEVIDLESLRAVIRRSVQRDSAAHGRVVRHPGVKAGAPIFAGTRIPVTTVQHYLDAGYGTSAILEEYPSLSAADVEEARRLAAAS